MRRKTKEQFEKEAKLVHGDKYLYNEVIYINILTKVKIFCKKCKDFFFQSPKAHLRGNGCSSCAGNKKITIEEFKKKSRKTHGDKYCYFYIKKLMSCDNEVEIFCKKHGQFFKQRARKHMLGANCPLCANEIRGTSLVSNRKEFIRKATKIHGKRYFYHLVVYINCEKEVKIFCKKHKRFFTQTPDNHLSGHGCPFCKESSGERAVSIFLDDKNIYYERQKRFDDCINPKTKRKLSYDFYIPSRKLLIEYDGETHFRDSNWFGHKVSVEVQQNRDKIKNNYAKDKNLKLLRIPYTQFKEINRILSNFFQHCVC